MPDTLYVGRVATGTEAALLGMVFGFVIGLALGYYAGRRT